MTVLSVITAPDPILTKVSSPVTNVDAEIQALMRDMLDTMYAEDGVGLAAIQVGKPLQIIVLDLQSNDDEIREEGFYPLFMANPRIVSTSIDVCEATEGCLSVPEQRVDVVRPSAVCVHFLNDKNERHEINAKGWLARVIQHEIDHLHGKLIIDYLSKVKRDVVVRKLHKSKKLNLL